MRAIKIRLKGYEKGTVSFKLYQFGFHGQCTQDCSGPVPITIGDKGTISSPKFGVANKVLSVYSVAKPVSVQIINLHGAVVHTQTVSPEANTISLSGLPTGVYMVRIPALGSVYKFANK